MVTHLVTFYIRPESDQHEHTGSFGGGFRTANSGRQILDTVDEKRMHFQVDAFLNRSAALCGDDVELHVLHNLNTSVKSRHHVTYHADLPETRRRIMPQMPTIDQRFWLLQRLVRQHANWDCIIAVDLTDVDVLRVPRCAELPPRRLLIASDNCGPGSKRWVMRKGLDAGFNTSWPSAFHEFVNGSRRADLCIANCGIIGGPRDILLAALHYVVNRLAQVWRSAAGRERLSSHRLRDPVGDMVAWNEYADAQGGIDKLISGYPFGPVNPPMYGHLRTPLHYHCQDECLYWWHNATAGRYYFGHKLPGWVRWLHLPPECRVPAPANQSDLKARRTWRGYGKHRPLEHCTLPQCAKGRAMRRESYLLAW